MYRYVTQRILLLILTLLGVVTITFVLGRVLPGSPVELMIGYRPNQEQIEIARKALGLDLPLHIQYLHFLGDAIQGDFGVSLHTKQPVITDIAIRSTATLELTVLAVIAVVLIGVPVGVVSAVRSNTLVDHATRSITIAGAALPVFMVGILLQMLFYGEFSWLPLQGRIGSLILLDHPFEIVTGFFLIDTMLAGSWTAFSSAASHIVLPATALTLTTLPLVARTTRNMMMDVLQEDHVRTALAYGLPVRLVHYRYALKATLIPLMTIVGLTFGVLLGGSVVVEFVFDWPGLGGYVVRSITRSDFPGTIGVTLFLAAVYLSINLVVDLLYFVVDPRLSSP